MASMMASSGTRVMDPMGGGGGGGGGGEWRAPASAPLASTATAMAPHQFRIHLSPLTGDGQGGFPGGGGVYGSGSARGSGDVGATGANVGPGAYTPRDSLRAPASPRASFGTAARFAPAGRGGYISPRHQSDLLCTASPGPKYNTAPTSATYPRQPALGWGDRNDALQRAANKKTPFLASHDANDVGPAAYSPRVGAVKESAPHVSFSRSARFGGPFGSYQVLNNSATSGAVSALQPNLDATTAQSPRFSFGPPRPTLAGEADEQPVRHKPRTSFMTHSIRGGLAKPATLECNIGPGDYDPRTGDLGDVVLRGGGGLGGGGNRAPTGPGGSLSAAPGPGFGSSPRFLKAGVQYLGAEHARSHVGHGSPGPKYLISLHDTAAQAATSKSQRSALKWVP